MRALLSGGLTLAVLAGGAWWLGLAPDRAASPAPRPATASVSTRVGLDPFPGPPAPATGMLFRWREGDGTVHITSERPAHVTLDDGRLQVFSFTRADLAPPAPAAPESGAGGWRSRLEGARPAGILDQVGATLDVLEMQQETLHRLTPGL